jgi:Ca-activated chloride channel homolog
MLIPTLTDEELSRSASPGEPAGFGSLAIAHGHLPLKAMDVRARIDGLLAHVTLTQTFVNTQDQPREATYIFPLPDRAAVVRFRMQVAGRVVEGQLKERGQARAAYDQAIQAGQRAAIAEEDRPNVFSLRVGNLMPGEEATVRLNLSGPLPTSEGAATFRFPLVVAPRYVPGQPLSGPAVGAGTGSDTDAVPDASRITPPVLLPGYPNPVRLSLTVDVHPSALSLGEFRCSLHSVVEAADDAGVRRIVLQPGARLDRDFILRFRIAGSGVGSSLFVKPDAAGSQEGTFALTLVPPADLAQTQRPRDVAFVLDRSGSMKGWKMVAARRALARMVETLTDRDRFSVYAFDDRIETPPELHNAGLVAATDRHRFLAAEFLGRIEARGGTEMAPPLELAVHTLGGVDTRRERILVLVTDGQVGNEDQILHHLGESVRHIRIFALGIDQAVNEGFLRRLAALGRGACELVESEQRLEEVMAQVHRHIGTPVLTGLRLEPAGFQVVSDSLMPARLPDLFAEAPLCVMGRYRGAAGTIGLQAHDAEGLPWLRSLKAETCDNPALGHIWARGHVRELEDRYVVGGSDSALEKRIVDTSLRFGVLCRFTAYVAVDRSETVNRGGELHQVTQAVEMPAGWGNRLDEALGIPVAEYELTLGDLSRVSKEQQANSKAFGATWLQGIKEKAARGLRLGQAQNEQARRPSSADGLESRLQPANAGTPTPRPASDAAGGHAGKDQEIDAARRGEAGARDNRYDASSDKDQILQVTTDHSLAQALVEAKTISPEEAKDHRFRNILWKYLGSKEVSEGPEVKQVPLTVGDRFLLCTDGLTGVVRDEDLQQFIRQQADVQTCAEGLGKLALDAGSRDNVSCVVFEVAATGSLDIGKCTLVGNYRENNEDAIDVKQVSDWTVCLVADGMGGQAAGEVASRRAVEIIVRELRRHLPAAATPEQVKAIIRKAVVQANEEIIAMGSLDRDLKNMGTTVVLAVWRKGSPVMYVTGVGESRCYHIAHSSRMT